MNKPNFNAPVQPCWNGEPIECRVVTIEVADQPAHKFYWARPYVGFPRQALEVGAGKDKFYIDNADGSGINKVLNGGSMHSAHRSLTPASDKILEVTPDNVVYPTKELYEAESELIESDCTALYGNEYVENKKRFMDAFKNLFKKAV